MIRSHDTQSDAIMKFLKTYDGADIVLVKHLFMKRFKMTESQWVYWLQRYRFPQSTK